MLHRVEMVEHGVWKSHWMARCQDCRWVLNLPGTYEDVRRAVLVHASRTDIVERPAPRR